jgi:hypothetical protein
MTQNITVLGDISRVARKLGTRLKENHTQKHTELMKRLGQSGSSEQLKVIPNSWDYVLKLETWKYPGIFY